MAALYIHIPFCKQACHYCDFHFSTGRHDMEEMTLAITREIGLQRDYLGHEPIESIYFGGGTPSWIQPAAITTILRSVHDHFTVNKDAEVTLEANPDDIGEAKLEDWQTAGVNRLSIGIQSFDDSLLTFMNRSHTAESARRSLELVRKAGFTNVSLDLIYGIPGMTMDSWKSALDTALGFRPAHGSAYALTVEENTVFGRWKKKGRLTVVDEEIVATQFEMLMGALETAGYEHYEISNFSLPGMYSRHNSSYWKQTRYLGIGPSAHSFDLQSRQYNVRNNSLYLKALRENRIPFEKEILSRENKVNEYILTTLRTHWGCDLDTLLNLYQDDLMARKGTMLEQWRSERLIDWSGSKIILTRKGKLLADKLAEELMLEA